jgi:hypothetical protein
MTEVESPLGKASFTDPQQRQNRVLTVDDQSDMQAHPAYHRRPGPQTHQEQQAQQIANLTRPLTPEEMEEITRKRAEAQHAKSRVSQTARDRIEFLTQIGRIRNEFEVDGVKFSFQSLKSRELEEIHDLMVSLGSTTESKLNLEVRKHVLARSLYAIDDIPVSDIIGTDELEAKLELIMTLDENLVDYMNKFYEEKIMKVGRDKYAIKSQEDMEELVEDVKKL